ncbi:tetratricopeptide repeat protein [Spirosoma sp. KNUC1025]|uniref:tetratricopeptide repeat protein n=1 Tax=Spirosoma sp. KNUC1025 TaxID=2894082 RepID=UPI00386801FF|nr:hypothetical protein LN737_18830 [Spirosoma sp. KNUC1025]
MNNERMRKRASRLKTGEGRLRYSGNHSFTRSLLYSFALSLVMLACGNDDRQGAYIPDFPKPGDSSRVEGALRALTRAINQSSPASAYAKRAVILLAMGRVSEALSDIDEAISRNDNAGPYYLTRAQILRALRKPDQALQNAQRAEILGVDTPELYTLQGDLLQQQNQFDKAKLYVAKALQMAPYDGEAYYFNGLMAARQGIPYRRWPFISNPSDSNPAIWKPIIRCRPFTGRCITPMPRWSITSRRNAISQIMHGSIMVGD